MTSQTVVSRRTGPAFVLLGAVQAMLISGITVLNVALPAVQEELLLSHGELALVASGYGLSFSGLLLLGGRLADLYGRRRLFLLGLAVFGAASAGAAPAGTFELLLAARFAQGAGAALTAPAAMALLRTVFPDPASHTRAIAVWGGLSGIGATVGTLLSGLFAQWGLWRWAFVLLVAASLAAFAAALRLVPADGSRSEARLDVVGAVLVTAGTSALSYGLLDGPAVAAVIGGLLLLAFVAVEARTSAPLVPLSFFASRPRAIGTTAIVLGSAGMASGFFFLSLHLQQDRELSPLLTSAIFLPFSVVLMATGAAAGRLISRFGPGNVLITGLFVGGIGLALVARLDAALPFGLLIMPLGIGLTFAAATVTVVSGVPDAQAGLAGGVANTAMEVGPTVGLAVLVASATGRPDGYGFALGAAALTFLLTSAAAAVLLRPRNRTTTQGEHL